MGELMDSRKSCGSVNPTYSTYSATKEAALTTSHQSRFLSFFGRNIKKALKLTNLFLPISALISSCIAIANHIFSYSTFGAEQTFFFESSTSGADQTYVFEVAQSLQRFGLKEIFNFVYAPATQIFPDLITAYISYFFSHDHRVTAVVVLFTQVGVMLAGAIYFFNVILIPGKRLPAYSLTLLCMAFALILQTKVYTFTFYPLGNSIHYCAFILALPISGLCIACLKRGGARHILLMGCLLFLGNLSTQSALPFITAPLMIYLAYYSLKFGRKKERKIPLLAGVAALLASLAGTAMAKSILPSNSGIVRYSVIDMDINSALERLKVYLSGLFFIPDRIESNAYVALVFGILLIFLAVFIWQNHAKKVPLAPDFEESVYGISRDAINTFFILTLCAITIIALITPSVYPRMVARTNLINFRYFNIVYIWAAAAFIFSVSTNYSKSHVVPLLICIISLAIALLNIASISTFDVKKNLPLCANSYLLVKEAKSAGLPLQNGFAPYFDARPTQIFLSDGNRIFAIKGGKEIDLFPHHLWLRPYPGNAEIYNYVVINYALPSYNVSTDILPPGYAVFKSENFPNVELYYYDNNALDDLFKNKYNMLMYKLNKRS